MAIEKIVYHHFQKHIDYTLELDPEVTYICGASRAGKSSALRGLRWTMLNQQPRKVNYATRGQDNCETILYFDGGNELTRKKSKSENYYELNGQKYEVPGQNKTPEVVKNALNVGELNFQKQIDLPFWFDLTPGQVSKELNSIIKLDVIDSSLSKIGSVVRSTKAEANVCKKRLSDAKKRKKELDWVLDLNEDLIELENMQKELIDLQNKSSRIKKFLENGTNSKVKLKHLSESLVASANVVANFPIELVKEKLKIEKCLKGLQQAKQKLAEAKIAEAKAKKELDEKTGGMCPICGKEIK
jgi:hypothetical protein